MAGAGNSSPIFGVQFPSLPPGFLPVTPLTTRLHLHQSLEGGRSFTKPEGRLCKTDNANPTVAQEASSWP